MDKLRGAYGIVFFVISLFILLCCIAVGAILYGALIDSRIQEKELIQGSDFRHIV